MPFQVHGQMRLAPLVRNRLNSEEIYELDKILQGNEVENESKSYLKEIKIGKRVPKFSGKTWPQEEKIEEGDDDVVVVGMKNFDLFKSISKK